MDIQSDRIEGGYQGSILADPQGLLRDDDGIAFWFNARVPCFVLAAKLESHPIVGRPKPASVRDTTLTQFAPEAWIRLYAPMFMFDRTWLCLPNTRSGNIDGEARRGWAEQRAGRAVAPVDSAVNPSPGTDAFGVRCSSRRSRQGCGADGLRRRRRCDRAFPADRADQSLRMPVLPR